MKKADLKVGYIVEFRNGMSATLLPTKKDLVLIDHYENNWYCLDEYADNLEHLQFEGLDIVKVWNLPDPRSFGFSYDDTDYRTPVWEEETKVMTVAEIEKKLGYKVKIVS